jgi:hypothetical protein
MGRTDKQIDNISKIHDLISEWYGGIIEYKEIVKELNLIINNDKTQSKEEGEKRHKETDEFLLSLDWNIKYKLVDLFNIIDSNLKEMQNK